MAKPDWGELQQRFLSEHAATGVSPKEWCEAQGLNYATARRYIKKTSAQTAQKSAQKKVRIAQKEQSANELMDDDGLTAQQRLFVAEYLKDGNATQAAIRAGYSKKSAEQIGYQLLQKTSVAQAIAQQQKASIARTLGGADEVLAQMWQLATFDANQLSQYRRGACRYCWGFGHQYQWRDMVEFEEKRLEALERKSREPADVGGYGYQQATATQINGITATVNGHTSAITTNAQAIANVNGDLKAMYNIKVGVSSNGQYYAAGMGIGVENTPSGMQSQVIFLADRFAVTHQAGATVTLPFVIQNGQVFIRDALIGERPEVRHSCY